MFNNKDYGQSNIIYADVFRRLEENLIHHYAEHRYKNGEILRDVLDEFKKWNLDEQVHKYRRDYREIVSPAGQPHPALTSNDYDAFYYWVSVYVIFFAGMDFQRVQLALPRTHFHFNDYRVVANYTSVDIDNIVNDPDRIFIHNRQKIKACWINAQTFHNIVNRNKSLDNYMIEWPQINLAAGLRPYIQNVHFRLQELRVLRQFGKSVTMHFLMDICEPVIKPDVHVCRVLYRLGFIALADPKKMTTDQKIEVSYRGVSMAQHAGVISRYVDMVLMRYGLHICTAQKPQCDICSVRQYCESFLGYRPY